jgi:tetratricopeptide repeat protein 8
MARALVLATRHAVSPYPLPPPLQDWWWKARLGQCYLRQGLLRDCEKQLSSALRCGGSVVCALQLAHCYLRMDQPTAALELYKVRG